MFNTTNGYSLSDVAAVTGKNGDEFMGERSMVDYHLVLIYVL